MTITVTEVADSRPALARREKVARVLGWLLGALLVGWLLVNLIVAPQQFVAVALAGLRIGALYGLIALGYTLVYGIIGLINFAHGDLFMLSSVFASILLVERLGADSSTPRNWLLMALALPVLMAACGGINIAAERTIFRRLRTAPRLASLVAAVGLSFWLQWLGLQLNGSGQRIWPTIIPNGGIVIGSVTLDWSTIVVTAVTVPLLLALRWIVQGTRHGKAMRAAAQDAEVATLMGVDVNRTIALTFAIGGALAGAAGLMYFETFGNTNYVDGFQFGLIAFTAAVLGGFLIGLLQAFNDGLVYSAGQQWSQSVVFVVLILVLVFKPEGILGHRTIEKV